jgi:hypothetical protein
VSGQFGLLEIAVLQLVARESMARIRREAHLRGDSCKSDRIERSRQVNNITKRGDATRGAADRSCASHEPGLECVAPILATLL